MREQVLDGSGRHSVGMTLVMRQGLWAWMMLATSDDESRSPSASIPGPTPTPLPVPVTVCSALFAAWTDLLVGAVRRQEAS